MAVKTRAKWIGPRKVRMYSFGPNTAAMARLAQFGIDLILDRTEKGIGSDDAPMKPLSRPRGRRWSKSQDRWVEYGKNAGYYQRKKSAGLEPIRDLRFSGDMLANISLRSVSDKEARIDITKSKERMKARANEIRSPWYGWSPRDVAKLVEAAGGIVKGIVEGFRAVFAGSRPSAAIWMNPWQHTHPGSVDARAMTGLRARIASGGLRPRKATGVSHPERRK